MGFRVKPGNDSWGGVVSVSVTPKAGACRPQKNCHPLVRGSVAARSVRPSPSPPAAAGGRAATSAEQEAELQSPMRNSYAVFRLTQKRNSYASFYFTKKDRPSTVLKYNHTL